MALWTPLLTLTLSAMMAMHASALDCYTAYVQRNFTDVEIPVGTFSPFPDLEEEHGLYYKSCITYTINGPFAPTFIKYPIYDKKLILSGSGIDGQGAAERCAELIVNGVPTKAFQKYIYANSPLPAGSVGVSTCCDTNFCNGVIGTTMFVMSSSVTVISTLMIISAMMFSYVLMH